jgi:hypothetical protein
MQLVDLEGTSIFGNGSDWFWAMAQFVVVVISLFGIYRQLQAQGAANALGRIETLHRRYESREMNLAKLSLAIQLRQGRALASMLMRVDTVAGFFETLYELNQAGFMSIREIDARFGGGIQVWWRLLKPTIDEGRRNEQDPQMAVGLERLNDLCDRIARDRGAPRTWITDGPETALVDEMIARTSDALELLNEVETKTIPRLPPAAEESRVDRSDLPQSQASPA